MAITIQVKRGVLANLAALSTSAGEPLFITDVGDAASGVMYISDGSTKRLIGGVEEAADHTSVINVIGRMVYDTTDKVLYRGTGSVWTALGVTELADLTGDTDDISEGSSNLFYTEGRVDANTNVAANTTHRGLTNNPHATDIENLGAGTLAELNDAVSDATLIDTTDSRLSDTRDPNAHASEHTDSTDDIQSATNAVKGLATAAQITALEANTTHASNTANPHATDIENLGSGTVAQLNSALSDATIGAGLNDAGSGASDLWSANKIENRVQQAEAGTDFKQEVVAATIANITLANEQTIDGVSAVAGDRVLVKDQTDAKTNGIYTVVDSGAWTRTTDADTSLELTGAVTTAIAGTVNSGVAYIQNAVDPVIGTDNITWVIFNGAGAINAGVGLSKDGNTINANLGAGIVELPSDEIGVDVRTAGGIITTVNGTDSSTVTGAQLAILADVTTGVTVAKVTLSSNGVGVTVDNSTIAHTTGTLAVKALGIGTGQLAATSVTSAKLGNVVGNGLSGSNGSDITVAADSTTGATVAPVSVVANGVGVTVDNSTIIHTAGTLSVVSVDGGSF